MSPYFRLLALLIFVLIFAMMGYFLYRSLVVLLPEKQVVKTWFTAGYVFLWVIFFAGLFLEHALPPALGGSLAFIGYSFLLVVMYLLLAFVVIDLIHWVVKLFHITAVNLPQIKRTITLITLVVVGVAMIIGYLRFNHPAVEHLDLTVNKPTHNKELTIVFASDIHLGNSIGKQRLQRYVKLINAQNPDLILLGGDLTDRSIGPLTEQKLYEELSQLKAEKGVYGILGNHEHYSGHTDSLASYFEDAGIRMLRDEVVLIDSSLYIIGREDRTNNKRQPLNQLMAGLDSTLASIVLDHQPYKLEEAADLNIDLQLSGHTHNGQVFPGNLIVKRMFENPYGYLLKQQTHVYVSSGLGIWGPLYRIGTRSELVTIRLHY
jgi:predicted MPP superfamily phosphohydrolase